MRFHMPTRQGRGINTENRRETTKLLWKKHTAYTRHNTMFSLSIGIIFVSLHVVQSIELQPRCETIRTPMCKDLGKYYKSERMYNATIYPNILEHRNQDEAALEVHQFFPLIKVNCSQHMLLFLCTVYVPMCTRPLIRPCRSLCEEVRDDCLPLMRSFGFAWPETLKCEQYPRKSKKVCFGGPSNETNRDKGKKKETTCKDCLENSVESQKLSQLCGSNDIVLVGKVMNIRGDRRVKFRVKQQVQVKSDIGKIIKKRLRQRKMMVKLSFPKKACVGKCKKFEKGKTYVVFLKIKKGKRAVYNHAGVILYRKGMKIC